MNTNSIHKSLLLFAIAIFFTCFSNICSAQFSNTTKSILCAEPGKVKILTDFKAKLCEGTVYLNWLMPMEQEDCVFLIQKSYNNIEFETIGTKRGVGGDVKIDLLYCFSEKAELVPGSYIFYRICKITKDQQNPVYSEV
ncbi:MAG: hypothetical protein ABIJ16_09965, partial [Bacteroidota bacterium]